MEIEEWRDVKGYEGMYLISNYGNVVSLDRKVKSKNGYRNSKGRSITVRKNNFGYLDTRLYKNGTKKSAFIHRIVAEAFLPNPENKPVVNHKNGIKSDNRLCNLEWCTSSENKIHAIQTGLSKNPKMSSREVIDTCTGEAFPSISKAAKANQIPYGSCKNMLRGIRKNHTCLQFAE